MGQPATTPSIHAFGVFELDLERHELRRQGRAIALQPKTFSLLCYFVAHPGRLLPKSELIGALWPDVVVTEHSLTRCVKDLRRALDESVQAPRHIETVAKKGYRFNVLPEPDADQAPGAAPAQPALVSRGSVDGRALRTTRFGIFALVLLGLLAAAWWMPRGAAPTGLRLAVLPFATEAGVEPPTLGDRLAEDLIEQLRAYPQVQVISSGSAFALRDRAHDPAHIANTLGVDWIVHGDIAVSGERMRVQLTMLDARPNGSGSWKATYHPLSAEWLALPAQLAADLHARWAPAATAGVVPHPPDSASFEAHMHYRLGRELLERRRQNWRALAGQAFDRALAIDPGHADALAGRAMVLVLGTAQASVASARAKSLEALQQAQAGARPSAWVHAARGLWLLRGDELARAEEALRAALVLDPGLSLAHNWLSIVLSRRGDEDASLRQIELALQHDPISPLLLDNYATGLALRGRLAEAQASYQRMLEIPDPPASAWIRLASLEASQGKLLAALDHASELERFGDPAFAASARLPIVIVEARLGLRDVALAGLLAAEREHPPISWHPHLERGYRLLGEFGRLQSEPYPEWLQRSGPLIRGRLASLSGRHQEAVDLLGAALGDGPLDDLRDLERLDATLALGYSLRRLGRFDAAEAWLLRVRKNQAAAERQGIAGHAEREVIHALSLYFDDQADAAIRALHRAQAAGWNNVFSLWHDPRWQGLREHPELIDWFRKACASVEVERQRLAQRRGLAFPPMSCPGQTADPLN